MLKFRPRNNLLKGQSAPLYQRRMSRSWPGDRSPSPVVSLAGLLHFPAICAERRRGSSFHKEEMDDVRGCEFGREGVWVPESTHISEMGEVFACWGHSAFARMVESGRKRLLPRWALRSCREVFSGDYCFVARCQNARWSKEPSALVAQSPSCSCTRSTRAVNVKNLAEKYSESQQQPENIFDQLGRVSL